jgi:hypothetical protein
MIEKTAVMMIQIVRKIVRRLEGKEMDLRLNGDRLEFGRERSGKEKKKKIYITDSLKLSKMFREMLVQLATECENNEQIVRKLRTIRILHSANRFKLLTMDIPKGYIFRLSRSCQSHK